MSMLSACLLITAYFRILEPFFMKLGLCIMASEPI
jgi:hypothetical protein